MILEAKRDGCFSTAHVLKLDDRPVGRYEGRWFGEGIDIDLLGNRRWRFHKSGWLSSEFVLQEEGTEKVLARAVPAGIFTSKWSLELSVGTVEMAPAGWFSSEWVIRQDGNPHGRVGPLGVCQSGWTAENTGSLDEQDLLVAGLVYQIVMARRAQSSSAAAGS